MKKLNITMLAIGMAFALTGCQNKEELSRNEINKSILYQVKREGVLLPLGGALNSFNAGNLLKLKSGKTIFVKSKNIDLNTPKYLNKTVDIWGKSTFNNEGNELIEVSSVDLIEEEKVEDTSVIPEWELLESSKLGISLKYRNDYKYTEMDNVIKFVAPMEADQKVASEINIKLVSTDKNYNLREQLGLTTDTQEDLKNKGLTRSKITLSGLDAYKKLGMGGKQIDFYLNQNNKTWSISFIPGDGKNLTLEQNLFFDLLASINLN